MQFTPLVMKQNTVCQLSEPLTSLQVPPAPVVEPSASGCQNLLLVKRPAKSQNTSTIDLKDFLSDFLPVEQDLGPPIVAPHVYCCSVVIVTTTEDIVWDVGENLAMAQLQALKPAGDFSHIKVDAHTDCADLGRLCVGIVAVCELPAALCSVFEHPVVQDNTNTLIH